MIGRLFTMKALIRAAFTALSLANIGVAHSQTANMVFAASVEQASGHTFVSGIRG